MADKGFIGSSSAVLTSGSFNSSKRLSHLCTMMIAGDLCQETKSVCEQLYDSTIGAMQNTVDTFYKSAGLCNKENVLFTGKLCFG